MLKELIGIRNARLLACDAHEEISVMEEKLIAGMCFEFLTNVSIHACDKITQWLVEMN